MDLPMLVFFKCNSRNNRVVVLLGDARGAIDGVVAAVPFANSVEVVNRMMRVRDVVCTA